MRLCLPKVYRARYAKTFTYALRRLGKALRGVKIAVLESLPWR